MADPWTFTGERVPLASSGDTVTLVEGSAFCISSSSGDIHPHLPQGLFFRDNRLLSKVELRVNGAEPECLSSSSTDPFSAVFVGRSRPRPGRSDSTLMVFRYRYVGRGMREDVVVRNFAEEPAYCALEMTVDVDFAHVLDVKTGHVEPQGEQSVEAGEQGLEFRWRRGGSRRGTRITSSEKATFSPNLVAYEVIVPARGEWRTCLQVTPVIDGEDIEPRYRCGVPVERATPGERLAKWRREVPVLDSDDDAIRHAVQRSLDDLGALRIFDPDHPERAVVAAGAPWHMTLFGRDSLLTSWMALLVDPDLALGVLQTLARFQGKELDPRTDEEPGRILHEMRFGEGPSLSLGGGPLYYGTADATPLFVMLLGELRRWGLAREAVDSLLSHADRAIAWMEEHGDRDGDGYIEYQRASDRGLENQGWKHSEDAVRFFDGAVAKGPIALAEVQAYAYGAYLARAHFAEEVGDDGTSKEMRQRAADLKERFNEDFWVDERGWFAMALDGDKRPVDGLASNMGHCLWTGIVDEEKAGLVARHLLSPDMFSGWGIRTLGASNGGYNPMSEHSGSVWPHDNAITAAGLMRYGFVEEAQRVILALLAAAATRGGRLPELFTGLDRHELPTVVGYPTSCAPQACAASSPLLFLRTLLRFDPWVPHGKLWLDPAVPAEIGRLHVHRIPLKGGRVSVLVEADGSVSVDGLPPALELVREPRHPLTAT